MIRLTIVNKGIELAYRQKVQAEPSRCTGCLESSSIQNSDLLLPSISIRLSVAPSKQRISRLDMEKGDVT
jgi:hypothetical protein